MNKQEFRQWIVDNFHVGDNCTMGPKLLDAVLDHAEGMDPVKQQWFLRRMFDYTGIQEAEIARVRY